MDDNSIQDAYFISLIYSISQAAMMQLGKVSSPITGKIERDLNQARTSIDMLIMLKEKTKGNLSKSEDVFINDILSTLQLNYAEEADKSIPATNIKETDTSTRDKN